MERTPAPPPNAVRVAPAYSTTRAASLGILASFAAFSVAAFAKVVIAEPRFSGAVLFGVLTSSFVVLLVLQRRLVGWMGAVATITTLGWLPFLGLGVIFAPDAIVDTMKLPTDGLRLRTVVLLAGLAGTIPALALSMSLSKRVRLPRVAGALRGCAWGSLALIVIATTVALSRTHRPDADTYVASLPVMERIRPGTTFSVPDGPALLYRYSYFKGWQACVVEGVEEAAVAADECTEAALRYDRPRDLWIVDDGPRRMAFGRDRRARALYPSDVAPSLAPPLGWIVGAGIGLVFEMSLLIAAVRASRRHESPGGVEGTLCEDGMVEIPGESPMRFDDLARAGPGPVVLHLRQVVAHNYRDAGVLELVTWRFGTIAQVRDELAGDATTLYALATTSGLLCAAPLLFSCVVYSR